MATVKGEATIAALVLGTTGPVVMAQIGLLSWGALVGGTIAVAMMKEPVSIPKGIGLVALGVMAACVLGGTAAHVLPQMEWAKSYGLSAPMLWMPVGFAIGAFWRQAWNYADRWLSKGKQ